jgi:hypothetical protein
MSALELSPVLLFHALVGTRVSEIENSQEMNELIPFCTKGTLELTDKVIYRGVKVVH